MKALIRIWKERVKKMKQLSLKEAKGYSFTALEEEWVCCVFNFGLILFLITNLFH